MLAIAVLRSRVAPVLDWCSTFVIHSEACLEEKEGTKVVFENHRGYEMLKSLHDRGVESVICGALTRELLDHARHLGIQIISGVAGTIPEILEAYQAEELDHPRYRLPGCRWPCRYRRRRLEARSAGGNDPGEEGLGSGAQGSPRLGRGRPGGCESRPGVRGAGREGRQAGGTMVESAFCVCPRCGMEVTHPRGIPCAQMQCSQCGGSMRRK